jgi:hypothetical protein
MIDVSIPCEKCRKPIRFGLSKCAACGSIPSRAARAALRERLAASSADFRELQEHIHAARTVFLILALVYLAYGALSFMIQSRSLFTTPEDDAAARAAMLENVLIGVTFVACWWAARAAPLVAIVSATCLWLGLQIVSAIVVSLSIFAGLWLKGVAAILLVRGIVASVKANNFLRKVREPAK